MTIFMRNMGKSNIYNIFQEIVKGIKISLPYLLSHHNSEEYYKCYNLKLKKRNLHICSRCLGIYFGIIIGILLSFAYFNHFIFIFSIYIFPVLTIIEWYLVNILNYKGYNLLRSTFGFLLGISYIFGIVLLIKGFYFETIIAFCIWSSLGILLLSLKWHLK